MGNSVFDTEKQHKDTKAKIVVGLERISEAFRVLLWDHAKEVGLSPIQIRILIFIKYHAEKLCNVSYLAKEFNVTKPTISDAVKTLKNKNLISKNPGINDARSYSIRLQPEGEKIIRQIEGFAFPIKDNLSDLGKKEEELLLNNITRLIYKLNKAGIISVQRTCFGCQFYAHKGATHYCKLMETKLEDSDIRLDCAEYQEKTTENIKF